MYRNYLPPIFPWGQGPFLALCFVGVATAMLLFPRKKRVLLITMFLMAAWQGGAWVDFIMMDIRIFHFALLVLLLWNLSAGKFSLRQWKPFIKPLTPWFLLMVWQALDSGSKARVLEVSLDSGESVVVPRANVELIEG